MPAKTAAAPDDGDDPAGYLPDPGLVDAVNVALFLRKPLLVTGDPGTGKTQLAYSVAWQLASGGLLNVRSAQVEKFETKSSSVARDLFYTFDAIRRFQMARESAVTGDDSGGNAPFITYNALGRALLRGLAPARIPAQVRWQPPEPAPARSVVLIDEIDKAPRDFPNDLLNEIEHMYFRVPELENVQVGGPGVLAPDFRPIVIVTSNSEKNLPEPFLRRCAYYHIPFPSLERLQEILLSRLPHFATAKGPLLQDALRFFARLRDRNVTRHKTSPTELIDWLAYMLARGAKANMSLADARTHAVAGLSALTKDHRDQEPVRGELAAFLETT